MAPTASILRPVSPRLCLAGAVVLYSGGNVGDLSISATPFVRACGSGLDRCALILGSAGLIIAEGLLVMAKDGGSV